MNQKKILIWRITLVLKGKMRTKFIVSVGVVAAILDVCVPYLILKDTTAFWANYVFWTLLTMVVIIFGLIQVRDWGE